jgi:2-aminoadipate transaminase
MSTDMPEAFARRMGSLHRSFIREILKLTADPEVISFAGGLPNPRVFPTEAIARAAAKVLAGDGTAALQYGATEGHLPLREYIAERYFRRFQLAVSPDEILITTGSQQALDLIGKVLLDPGDALAVESPGFLGALQAFSMYEPVLRAVPLLSEGVDVEALGVVIAAERPKLFYAVPNFQNPSGTTYSDATRRAVAELLRNSPTYVVEDDPYGDLRFLGEHLPPIRCYLPRNTILLGSFSKTVAPGLRIGWLCAGKQLMEKLVIAKQASDLHTSYLGQCVLAQYLRDNDLDAHIEAICSTYKRQRDLMVQMIEGHCPPDIHITQPEGGMFLWVTLAQRMSSLELFGRALRAKVAFVPGSPFHIDGGGDDTLRLNFSNCDEAQIGEGIRRLAKVMSEPPGVRPTLEEVGASGIGIL